MGIPAAEIDPSESTSEAPSEDTWEVKHDPFFAFIPQLARWGTCIIGGELNSAKSAVIGFPTWYKGYLLDTYDFYKAKPRVLYKELISGFTVAIMQVPESIAFSFVAGVPPVSGMHATFWMATITGAFGGKPGMISGAAGALAVVVADLTADDGVLDYLDKSERLSVLYMTMFVCGLMQIAFAVLRLAKLVRLIPETGMIGFMNGLAIIIFMAQLPVFQYCPNQTLFVECTVDERKWLTFQENTLILVLTLAHVFGCMLIMKFFSKIPKIGKVFPPSLIALLMGTLIEHTLFRKTFGVATRTVEETAPVNGDFPSFNWPDIPTDSNTISVMFQFAITLASIGAVESVLTLQACNEITDTVPQIRDSNQELFAQGLANTVCGLFSAMGGDAMIGQSTINIMNGARRRVSSTMSGVFMLLFVVALSPLIDLLPVATLTGVLFMVVLSTFQWKTFMILRYGRLSDSCAILLVTLLAIFFNLAIAIVAGILFSALVHAWDSGNLVDAVTVYKRMIVNGEVTDVKFVRIQGAIFFGSSRKFINLFNVAEDPPTIIIDFENALVIDHSAVAAIQGITHRFAKVGKRVLLTNLPKKSHRRMQRTGDHDMLREQVTDSSHFQNVDIETDTIPEESSSSEQTKHTDDADSETEYEFSIQDLPMFQKPVEGVDTELAKLAYDQGQVSIHET